MWRGPSADHYLKFPFLKVHESQSRKLVAETISVVKVMR